MRKLIMVAIILMVGVGVARAQKDVKAVGLNLSYGSEISNLGIGAKFQYGITNAIRSEASLDYFLEKDGLKMWDGNVNFHYLFNVNEEVKVYPVIGLSYTNWSIGANEPPVYIDKNENDKWDSDEPAWDLDSNEWKGNSSSISEGKLGVNVGVGTEYQLNEKWSVGAELKYQIISNFNQVVFGVGTTYRF